MNREEFVENAARKKVTGKLLVIFVVMMVLLTFFSNTINNFTLPRVTLESPTRGALIKEISGKGTVEAKSVYEEYIDTNLKVLEVNVKAGDSVKKGQPILSLDFEDLKANLQDENAKYRQMQIALEKLKDKSNLQSYDNNIASAMENLEKQKKNYQDIKTLYDSGFETAYKLKDAETAMNSAQRSYDTAVQAKEDFKKDSLRDIENAELNLEIQARKLQSLDKKAANNGVYTAPADGVITELNFSEGAVANGTKPLFKLADASEGFQLTIPVDRDLADYVMSGDKVDIDIISLGDKTVAGKLVRIKENLQDGDYKDLLIDIEDEELQGGESAQIIISKKTRQYPALVPNSAVYADSDGYYVYVVKKKDSPLGTESYVQRVDVIAGDSDSTMTAVLKGITPMEKVVSGSTKSLSGGDRVVVEQ
ncbi:MAG TPA: efflux RND transporter periplasmic adaptor subunit [Clostridia bacterium]|nr:efflux RND transporter periplasmic adaptor subunit [Clostridia bacterium]